MHCTNANSLTESQGSFIIDGVFLIPKHSDNNYQYQMIDKDFLKLAQTRQKEEPKILDVQNYCEKNNLNFEELNVPIREVERIKSKRRFMEDINFADYSLPYTHIRPEVQDYTKIIRNRDQCQQQYRTQITAQKLQSLAYYFEQYRKSRQTGKSALQLTGIADLLNLSKSYVSLLYKESLNDPHLTRRRMKFIGHTGRKRRQSVKTDLTDVRLQYLQKIILNNCLMTTKQITTVMNKIKGLRQFCEGGFGENKQISGFAVRRLLKRMGYVRKLIQKSPPTLNSNLAIDMREIYCRHYHTLLKSGAEIYFFGANSFHIFMNRCRGWAKLNQMPKIKIRDPNNIISLLCAISVKRIHTKSIKIGAFSKLEFMKHIRLFLQQFERTSHQKYLMLENLLMNHKSEIDSAANSLQNDWRVIYLPLGSPLINPLEGIFRQLRSMVARKTFATSLQLSEFVEQEVGRFESKPMKIYFDEAEPYIESSIKRVPL